MTTSEITFITGNQHKADNMARYLGFPIDHQKVELDEIQSIHLRDVVEHKVRQAYDIVQKPVIVDDVSLEFTALGGLPGPFVRFFVENGVEIMCRMLEGFDDRSAVGKSGIGYFDGTTFQYFEGEIHGAIADAPRGDNGYGWDSIFMPEGYGGKTRAELDDEHYEKVYGTIRRLADLKEFLISKDNTQ